MHLNDCRDLFVATNKNNFSIGGLSGFQREFILPGTLRYVAMFTFIFVELFSFIHFVPISNGSLLVGSFSSAVTRVWSHMGIKHPFSKHPQTHQMCAAWANSASSLVKHEMNGHSLISLIYMSVRIFSFFQT